jgi:antitoxin FitA
MASLTIRNLDDALKTRLRVRAAVHGRSMEEEARVILGAALDQEAQGPSKIGSAIHALFAPLGGLELPDLPREPLRDPPRFDE